MATNDSMQCVICAEIYRQPCILRCSHTFCKVCINSLTTDRRVKCPLCNSVTKSNGIKPNYALIDALEQMQNLKMRLKNKCKLEISDVLKCDLCTKRKVAFRCVDCDVWMCEDCKLGHLKIKETARHALQTLMFCNNEMEDSLNITMKLMKEIIDKHASLWTTEISAIQEIQNKTLHHSAELRNKYIADINTRFNEIDGHIRNVCMGQINEINRNTEDLNQHIDALKNKVAEIENFIKRHTGELGIEGKTILSEAETLAKSLVPDCQISTPFCLEVEQWPKWQSDEDFVMKCSGGDFIKPKPHEHHLSKLPCVCWRQEKSVKLPSYPNSLRIIEEKIWQCHKDGICVFTLDLEQVKQIQSAVMGEIYDVTSTGRGEIVVAAKNGLYSLMSGAIRRYNLFTSVCFYRHQLFAVDDAHTVRVYIRSGSTWTQYRSFSVEEGWATMCVNRAGVFVCVTERNVVYFYSHSGELLSDFGNGAMQHPRLCSVDCDGKTLIADRGNHCLKVMDSDTWSIIELLPYVRAPRCALFYKGRLFVNSSFMCFSSLRMYIPIMSSGFD